MSKADHLFRALRLSVVAIAIFAAGCGSNQKPSIATSVSNSVSVVPAALLSSIVSSVQQPISQALSGWEWSSFITSFGPMLASSRYGFTMQKVTYQSTGADGNIHTMTGLLILPQAVFGSKPSAPILMYQHGTESYRPYSPSQYLGHMNKPTDYPEVMVAAAIASNGIRPTEYGEPLK